MENVNKTSNSFYLLKKKIKNEDFIKLTSHSYISIFNILYQKKPKVENITAIKEHKNDLIKNEVIKNENSIPKNDKKNDNINDNNKELLNNIITPIKDNIIDNNNKEIIKTQKYINKIHKLFLIIKK